MKCCTLRTACMWIGWIGMIIHTILLISIFFVTPKQLQLDFPIDNVENIDKISKGTYCILEIILNALLLIGFKHGRRSFILPWLIKNMMIIVMMISLILMIGFTGSEIPKTRPIGFTFSVTFVLINIWYCVFKCYKSIPKNNHSVMAMEDFTIITRSQFQEIPLDNVKNEDLPPPSYEEALLRK